MIIDYKLNEKYLPSDREVWLMSKKAQKDGYKVDMALMRALSSGEIKYHEGKFYKICRCCMDYLPLEEFYSNKRYTMGVGYICKSCTKIRRRIRQYGVPTFISDVGMKFTPVDLKMNVKEGTAEILKRRLSNIGFTQEEDV